jgi:hypothetical protein
MLIFSLCAVAAVASLLVLCSLAFYNIYVGTLSLITVVRQASLGDEPHSGVQSVLHGLELLFLAPMPYLTVLTLAQVVHTYRAPSLDPSAASKLAHAKGFLSSLIIALLATDLARKLVSSSPPPLQTSLLSLATIIILMIYYAILSYHALGHDHHTTRPDRASAAPPSHLTTHTNTSMP